MKKSILLFFFVISYFALSAQEREDELRGTIKIQRAGQLSKVMFDDVNYRLVGIDRYGNPLDSAVVEFQMGVTVQGIFYREQTTGNLLSYKMQQLLSKCDQSTKIFFDKIKAKDRSGTVVDMPKFSYSMGSRNDDN